jgi:D-galactarolactone cycloisomerase
MRGHAGGRVKITAVRTYVLKTPLETPFYYSQPGLVTQRASLVVEVRTDEGLSGFGEALCHGLQPPEIAGAAVDSCLRDMIVGRDPSDVVVLYEEMTNRVRDFGMKGAVVGAISAIDIALWDLLGQALGQPVHKLLGGAFRMTVRPYATGFYRVEGRTYPDALAEEARGHLEAGFGAMKVKVGFGIEEDVRAVAAVREAVGPDVRLMLDANHAYDVGTARRLIGAIEPYDVYWLEEPIPPEDLDGYVRLRAMAPRLLIASGENEYSRTGFWPWIQRGALDVVQPDVAMSGGFTGLTQIATLATAAGIRVNPHTWGTAISLVASLHVIATIPPVPISRAAEEPMLEYDRSSHPFRRDLIAEAPDLADDGRVAVPTGPGLGIEVDRAVLERYDVS